MRKYIKITRKHNTGMALPTVLVLLLLSVISVYGAFRVGILNELMVSNSSDYNRTKTAAEALMRDAELDVRGRRPPYTVQTDGTLGFPCRPNPATSTTTLVTQAGYVGCRNKATANTPWFPISSEEFDEVNDIVKANDATWRCKEAICMPSDTTLLANIEAMSSANLATLKGFAATYGQFTRQGLANPSVTGNPLLNLTGANAKGWYWVEAFRYAESVSSGATNLTPESSANFVYRITVIAEGMRTGSRVVLKSTFIPFPSSQGL